MKPEPSSVPFSNVLQILGEGGVTGRNQRYLSVWMEVDQIAKRRIHILPSMVLTLCISGWELNSGGNEGNIGVLVFKRTN